MGNKNFKPHKGQFFWHIKEVEVKGFPYLHVISEKFDPTNKQHKKYVKNNNCYFTEDEAYNSLM